MAIDNEIKIDVVELWEYFLFLEKDLENTSRFMQPKNQENVYSYEFVKICILACVEIESLLRSICIYHNIKIRKNTKIIKYRDYILSLYPNIIHAEVYVKQLRKNIRPFENWDNNESLPWWHAYNCIKHSRTENYIQATYMNAVTTLAATYVLLLYLAEMTGELLPLFNCHYFDSKYNYPIAAWGQLEALPDFPDSALKEDSLYKYINDDILLAKDGFTIEYKAKSQSESTVKKV